MLTVRKIRLLTETEISATGVAAEVTADEAPNSPAANLRVGRRSGRHL